MPKKKPWEENPGDWKKVQGRKHGKDHTAHIHTKDWHIVSQDEWKLTLRRKGGP